MPKLTTSGPTVLTATQYEALARQNHARLYTGSYDDSAWPVRRSSDAEAGRRARNAKNRPPTLFFGMGAGATRAVGFTPWPNHFAGAVKLVIALEERKHPRNRDILDTAGLIYRVLSRIHGPALTGFRWSGLTSEHCSAVMELIRLEAKSTAVHGEANRLSSFVRILARLAITPAFEWSHGSLPASQVAVSTIRGQLSREDRLPHRETVDGLARLYHEPTLAPWEALIVRAAGLLVLTGLRINELLSLGADCLVTEERYGRTVYGIRYENEKNQKTGNTRAVRWLSPLSGLLGKRLVEEIGELTAPARARAKVLEANEDRFPLPEPWASMSDAPLTEIVEALGYSRLWIYTKGKTGDKLLGPLAYPDPKGSHTRSRRIRIADVERAMLAERGPLTATLPDGRTRPLSEMLFVITRGSVPHGLKSQEVTLHPRPLFVDLLRDGQLQTSFGENKKYRSIFERWGVTWTTPEGEVRPCTLRLHALRHWLNTLANRSGMTAYQVTRWMHRTDIAQTALYLHERLYDMSASEVAETVTEEALDGRLLGRRADEIRGMKPEAAREHLAETMPVAYVVGTGYCTANFEQGDSCAFQRACTDGCRYHLSRRTAPDAIAATRAQLTTAQAQLQRLNQIEQSGGRIAEGVRDFATRYISRLETTLAASQAPVSSPPVNSLPGRALPDRILPAPPCQTSNEPQAHS